jgi:hypothetical protein
VLVGAQEEELAAELDVGSVDEDREVYEDELEDSVEELEDEEEEELEDKEEEELEDEEEGELEDEEEEPVAQEAFPAHASLGMAAAEPTRAATKSERDECILIV